MKAAQPSGAKSRIEPSRFLESRSWITPSVYRTSTQAPAVDLSLDPEQRRIGGLGLHFVRSTMDEMTYHRRGNRNHLLMKKRIGETI